jgi:hypothetical protein
MFHPEEEKILLPFRVKKLYFYSTTLKTEAKRSSEISLNIYQIIRCDIEEDSYLYLNHIATILVFHYYVQLCRTFPHLNTTVWLPI